VKINGIEVPFRWCPAGKFKMGSPFNEIDRDNDEFQHEIILTRGFWIAETETTQELFESITGGNPSKFFGKKRPVEQTSWNESRQFISALNKANVAPTGYKFSLPTEAQWEYACRAGTTGSFAGNLDAIAWYENNSGKRTHDVGTKSPNKWRLYDMHGNVWEWCDDRYSAYPTNTITDPT
jgi:formylglycine-generating enzyme required for sulfatase activity